MNANESGYDLQRHAEAEQELCHNDGRNAVEEGLNVSCGYGPVSLRIGSFLLDLLDS